jgi:hypothetical protein
MTDANEGPSQTVLDETPGRVLTFLTGVARQPAIFTALASRGYSSDEHAEGWRLLHDVAGYDQPPAAKNADDATAQKAIAEIDAWDEPNFRWIRAALDRKFPKQSEFVFENLAPATGVGALLSVTTMLDRLDALESNPKRKETRTKDHAALELLATRGLTAAERKRLRGLIETAQSAPSVAPAPARDAKQQQHSKTELRAWFVDWSETARTTITRRDYLILLGLAQRKRRKKSPGGTPTPPADPQKT